MYASLSLELFMHLLLVVFTWQRHFEKEKEIILFLMSQLVKLPAN